MYRTAGQLLVRGKHSFKGGTTWFWRSSDAERGRIWNIKVSVWLNFGYSIIIHHQSFDYIHTGAGDRDRIRLHIFQASITLTLARVIWHGINMHHSSAFVFTNKCGQRRSQNCARGVQVKDARNEVWGGGMSTPWWKGGPFFTNKFYTPNKGTYTIPTYKILFKMEKLFAHGWS